MQMPTFQIHAVLVPKREEVFCVKDSLILVTKTTAYFKTTLISFSYLSLRPN